MANILIISGNLKDWTKNSGGKERTATLAEGLAEDHNVTFLTFSWDGPPISRKLENGILQIQPQIEPVIQRKYKQLITDKVKNNHDAAFQILKPELKNFSDNVKKLSKDADIIIFDHYSVAPFAEDISSDKKIIYSSHNAEIVMANQLYPKDTDVIDLVRQMESTILKRSIATVYCSEKDFAELKDIYDSNLKGYYVPNGTVMQELTDPKVRMGSKNILFVGSGHLPNVIAAKKLIQIAQIIPNYNFIVCGGASDALNKRLLPDNIYPMGHVSDEDLHTLFENSFAFINPMESGSGTHLKMMKALSYGIPIITSDIGARGFSKKEIEDCMLIANTPAETVTAINKLNNENSFVQFSNNAHKLSNNYDWEKIKKDYSNLVESLIDKKIEQKITPKENKQKVLIYSIIRNREEHIARYHAQIKAAVELCPEYEFYLSVYENDSTDGTVKEILNKNWSFLNGISVVSEKLDTKYFGSVKDAQRVENLANARNRGIESGGFLDKVDYVLMVEGDVRYDPISFKKLLDFKNFEPKFDIVSSISLKKSGTHYDWWATRTSPIFVPDHSEIEEDYKNKHYGKYYSTSNGLCLYRAKPFQEGIRHHWINSATGEFDCEMVVLCQKFHEKGYSNIFIDYKVIAHHV